VEADDDGVMVGVSSDDIAVVFLDVAVAALDFVENDVRAVCVYYCYYHVLCFNVIAYIIGDAHFIEAIPVINKVSWYLTFQRGWFCQTMLL